MPASLRHSERGSTLPLTLGGLLATLLFCFFALNYANTIRWQIRAQNAADAAAQAILSLQTQDINEMIATLYAAGIEEYRARHILNAMVLTAHDQGGCAYGSPSALNSVTGCDFIRSQLKAQFADAVGRYGADVLALHRVTQSLTFPSLIADAQAMMTSIRACNGQFGGDCAFNYGQPLITVRTDTESVQMDADGILMPYPGTNTGPSAVNPQLFGPLEVEAYACTIVPSIVPRFFGITFPSFTAVARGAATSIMVEQDWLQPGSIPNPFSGVPYQTGEGLGIPVPVKDPTGYDWYDLNFAGNGYVDVLGKGYGGQITSDEFSAYTGWWNSIPIHAFSGAKSLAAMGCPT